MAVYYNSETISHLGRLIKILSMVSGRGERERIGRKELADACECQVRTIARDLDTLLEAGIPITWDRSAGSYTLSPDWTYPVVNFTAADVMALAFARSLLAAPGTPHAEGIRQAIDKAAGGLSPTLRGMLAGMAPSPGSVAARDYSHAPTDALLGAIFGRESVEIDYESRSGGDRRWRLVDPYELRPRTGGYWDLHAWCHKNTAIRTFALDRIYGLRTTGQVCQAHEAEWEAFSHTPGVVGGLRGGEVVDVEVLIDAEVALYARDREWPPGLALTLQPDGSAMLTGQAQGTDGLVLELLSWRGHAVVIGGPALRAAMTEEIRAMVARYE